MSGQLNGEQPESNAELISNLNTTLKYIFEYLQGYALPALKSSVNSKDHLNLYNAITVWENSRLVLWKFIQSLSDEDSKTTESAILRSFSDSFNRENNIFFDGMKFLERTVDPDIGTDEPYILFLQPGGVEMVNPFEGLRYYFDIGPNRIHLSISNERKEQREWESVGISSDNFENIGAMIFDIGTLETGSSEPIFESVRVETLPYHLIYEQIIGENCN